MKEKTKKKEVEEIQIKVVEDEVEKEDIKQPESEEVESKETTQEVEQKKDSVFQKEFSSMYLVILGIILIAVVTLWGAISFGYMENPLSSKIITTPQPTANENSPSSLESTESANTTKDLKIQILNGSGIEGQAGKLKIELEDLGYQNIETGNVEQRDNKITTIKFGKDISLEDKKALLKKLENTFAEVESEDQENLEFDVVITTGSYK